MDFSKHSNGTTSVKVHHGPGGKSNFSLAWDTTVPTKSTKPAATTNPIVPLKESNQQTESTKVRNPPGGRSNIIFG
jgi:hypothetical protein